MRVQFEVNGKSVSIDTAPNTLLVQALRGELQLTGTHVGCDTAQCGACTVLVGRRSAFSRKIRTRPKKKFDSASKATCVAAPGITTS